MTADEAWVAVCGAWRPSGPFCSFGFTNDDRCVDMECLGCGAKDHVALHDATASSVVAAVRAFEDRHLRSCAESASASRKRIVAMADGSPVATTPDEARRLMANAHGSWPVGSAPTKGEA